ncbi:MAG TPA: hypothetical protein VHO50_02930 [Bacteroidales bacterium]|nr:hypothetical protein [Bacteroidales bacterium]
MKNKILLLLLIVLFNCPVASSQDNQAGNNEKSKLSFEIRADLVSRYIWRGLPLSLSSNIQPSLVLTYGNFSFGGWGSYSLSSRYSEADLFLCYDLGLFTLGLNDYYSEEETDLSFNDYSDFSNDTPHSIEGTLTFNGTESFPLSFTLGTFVYGADKDFDDNNYYSTYLEVSYSASINDTDLNFFLGGTPAEGYYSDKAAIVNLGITASHNLKISESFSLPVGTSFILNPDANDVFIVLGLTF